MQKFENVDVIAALGEIMRQNTAFYQSDFNIDKGIIQRAAASDQAVDKTSTRSACEPRTRGDDPTILSEVMPVIENAVE